MLRVYLKNDVSESRAKAILEAIGKPSGYAGYEVLGTKQQFFQYGGDPLDVTEMAPKEVPEDAVERVTLRTTIARFFRNDGQYKFGECKLTVEVVRTEKAGAPVQTVHIVGPSVGEVLEAYRAFRDTETVLGFGRNQLNRLENWGHSGPDGFDRW